MATYPRETTHETYILQSYRNPHGVLVTEVFERRTGKLIDGAIHPSVKDCIEYHKTGRYAS